MKLLSSLLLFTYATGILAAPKLLICSDSTTANYNLTSPLQGWGYHIGSYLSIPVVNLAKNGRSSRSFISEGLWQKLLDQTSAGDFVVIEMGHNDDSDPTKGDKYADRGTLPGLGEETKSITPSSGTGKATVHTFGYYLRTMVADVQKKSAIPILSGMIPRNYWDKNNKTLQSSWPFAEYAKQQAARSKIEFIDHTKYTVNALQALGPTGAGKLFPQDRTHTNDAGAIINAETFVTAVKCRESVLKGYLSAKGTAVKMAC